MGKNIFLNVLLVTIVLVLLAVFVIPGKEPSKRVHLPWQIEVSPQGNLKIFGMELGRTTLSEAEHILGELVVVSMFATDSGEKVVEGYFDNLDISGLRAKMVVVMDLSEEQLKALYERGVRVANIGGGRNKVTLSDSDKELVRRSPIASITYLPKANLDAEMIRARFGEPETRIKEKEGTIEHWLYPNKGLDIALDEEGKDVLQYVQRRDFAQLRQPLEAAAAN